MEAKFICGNIEIPCSYITSLSYSKSARLVETHKGFNRSRGFENTEISIRFIVTNAPSSINKRNFIDEIDYYNYDVPDRSTPGAIAYMNGFPICADIEFALTSVSRSYQTDTLGYIYAAEFEYIFSGVSISQEKGRKRMMFIDHEENLNIPSIELSCNGHEIVVDKNYDIDILQVTETSVQLGFYVSNDSKIIDREWCSELVKKGGKMIIDGHGEYFVISGSIKDEHVMIEASIHDASWNRSERFTALDTRPGALFSEYKDNTGTSINYINFFGTKKDMLDAIQASCGFIVDHERRLFERVPSSISSQNTFSFYIESDETTEPITGVRWTDNHNEYMSGNNDGALYEINAVCRIDDERIATQCLDYVRFMQNEITIEAPLNPSIRQWSAINVIKNNHQIPAVVRSYTFDYISNMMRLALLHKEN